MCKSNYFKKFIDGVGFVPIYACSSSEYFINTTGIIIDKDGLIIPVIVDEDGDLSVEIRIRLFGNSLVWHKVSHIVQHTFKPTSLPLETYNKIDVLYRDNDKTNLHPSNLVWHWTALEHWRYPGYAIIPGASNYCINKEGEVIKINEDKKVNIYRSDGYSCCSIKPDIGNKFKARIHRLLCLAWTDYPSIVDDLNINHKDAIRSNNDFSNMEWCTPKENAIHAYENDLYAHKYRPVVSRELFINRSTFEIYYKEHKFKSLAHCGRYYKVDEVTIGVRLKRDLKLSYIDLNEDRSTITHQHCVQFKLDDGSDWLNPSIVDDPYLNSQVCELVKVRNILTGEVVIYKSPMDVANTLKVNYASVIRLIIGNTLSPIYYFDIKRILDNSPWLTFTEDQLIIYKSLAEKIPYVNKTIGYKLMNGNDIKYFISWKEASVFLNISQQTFNVKCRQGIPHNNWNIIMIPLQGSLEPLLIN